MGDGIILLYFRDVFVWFLGGVFDGFFGASTRVCRWGAKSARRLSSPRSNADLASRLRRFS